MGVVWEHFQRTMDADAKQMDNWIKVILRVQSGNLHKWPVRRICMLCCFVWQSGLLAPAHAIDASKIEDFIAQRCIDCHDGPEAEGGLDLSSASFALSEPDDLRKWIKIHNRVETGEMPPADSTQPKVAERQSFLNTLGGALADADRDRQARYGRSELRRLSRAEFANALRDILDMPHLELDEMLPPDGLAHGFQKSAAALDFSHVMVTRYMEVADYALEQALVTRPKSIMRKTIRAELSSVEGVKSTLQTLFVQLKQTTGMPLVGQQLDPTLEVNRGNFIKREPGFVIDPPPKFDGVATFMNSRSNHNIVLKPFKVQQSGYYKLRVRGWGLCNDHGTLVPSDRSETVAFYSPTGRLLGRCDLPPNKPTTSETTVWLNEGEPVEYLAISAPNEKFQFVNKDGPRYDKFKAYGIGLQWFEMDGPLTASTVDNAAADSGATESIPWPPESHRRVLGDLTLEEIPTSRGKKATGRSYRVVTNQPKRDAKRLILSFARRALRRPATASDCEVALQMVYSRLDRGDTFIDSVLAGYRAILTSPDFLLVSESPGELDAWALATRLSLFLCNSPPDDELRSLAQSGQLLDENVLRQQTDRLLDDDKVKRFVNHFLDYWLDLRNIRLTEPDDNLYPEFNGFLTESMLEETRAYFLEMLRQDLGALHVVDSDFLMINQRMAELYARKDERSTNDGAWKAVQGSHTRRVPIGAGSVRGGLITQASVLKITGNGTTTSPVVRGTFALTKFLGDPPPPPPDAVPAIEPDISGATTIRQQLAQHRADPLCASCHRKIDPPGFALESFDVMGAYRTHYRATVEPGEKRVNLRFNGKPANFQIGLKVDSAGELPSGEPFEDINAFRQSLRAHEQLIARNLLEQLVVYATGSPIGFADRSIAEAMMERLEDGGYGARAMIHEIVQSKLFRNK
ncbi:MAG: DUF1592 domain-containing protein [Aureliella sp.]